MCRCVLTLSNSEECTISPYFSLTSLPPRSPPSTPPPPSPDASHPIRPPPSPPHADRATLHPWTERHCQYDISPFPIHLPRPPSPIFLPPHPHPRTVSDVIVARPGPAKSVAKKIWSPQVSSIQLSFTVIHGRRRKTNKQTNKQTKKKAEKRGRRRKSPKKQKKRDSETPPPPPPVFASYALRFVFVLAVGYTFALAVSLPCRCPSTAQEVPRGLLKSHPLRCHLPLCTRLIERDHPIDVQGTCGTTPFHDAVRAPSVEVCKLLIDSACSLDLFTGRRPISLSFTPPSTTPLSHSLRREVFIKTGKP